MCLLPPRLGLLHLCLELGLSLLPLLLQVCPMHGYLLGLGEEVSLWNTTAGGREKWPVLLGGQEGKSGGLGGGKKIRQALQRSDACTAAIVGDSEWLLLQTPAESAVNIGDTAEMGRDELLAHLSDGDKIQEKKAGSTLVLVRSSLPFTHMSMDIKNMIMAVGAGVIIVSIGWHVNYARTNTSSAWNQSSEAKPDPLGAAVKRQQKVQFDFILT